MVILYHLGTRRPQPRPVSRNFHHHWSTMKEPGAFFSPNWKEVLTYHLGLQKAKRLYIFECPKSSIQKAGGFHRYDSATEIFFPESLWETLRFLGSKEIGKRERKKFCQTLSFFSSSLRRELPTSLDIKRSLRSGKRKIQKSRKKDIRLIKSRIEELEKCLKERGE